MHREPPAARRHTRDRLLLDRGRLLASGAAAQLARDFMGVRYRLTTTQPEHPAIQELFAYGIEVIREVRAPRSELRAAAASRVMSEEWSDLILRMEPHHDPADVLSTLAGQGMRIAAFEPIRPSLADLIEGVVKRGENA